MNNKHIRTRNVLQTILLQILKNYHNGLSGSRVYYEIEKNYKFPKEWYRQIPRANGHIELEKMGIADWRNISQEELVQLVNTEPQWKNEIRWARNDLRKKGYLDTNSPRGIWKLNSLGMNSSKILFNKLMPQEKEIATPNNVKQNIAKKNEIKDIIEEINKIMKNMSLQDLSLFLDIAKLFNFKNQKD